MFLFPKSNQECLQLSLVSRSIHQGSKKQKQKHVRTRLAKNTLKFQKSCLWNKARAVICMDDVCTVTKPGLRREKRRDPTGETSKTCDVRQFKKNTIKTTKTCDADQSVGHIQYAWTALRRRLNGTMPYCSSVSS